MNRYYSSRAISVVAVLLTVLTVLTLTLTMLNENLKVSTLIGTCELDISYDDIEVYESDEAEGKDVGKCEYRLEAINNVEVLTILIKNGYPGYECTIRFNIKNTGIIPVTGPFFNVACVPEGVQVHFYPAEIAQLHPGDKASYSIYTKVLQNARESSEYVVVVEITYIQWNEYNEDRPPVQPIPELTVRVDFRNTNTNFTWCPVSLGTPLPRTDNGSYIVYATVPENGRYAGVITAASPGVFYFAMNITGMGITRSNITMRYDYQFDVSLGREVQVYVLNATTGCVTNITSVRSLAYSVDNENNTVTANITLYNPLPPGAIILVYVKYKENIKWSSWKTIDKHFEVYYTVEANIGSISGQAVIQVIKKS